MDKPVNKSEPTPYRLDDQIGYVLRLASQRHAAIFQSRSLARLTATQFSALVRVAEVGVCSQNHLGRLTAMDVATIKGVIDRLHKKALVALNPDPKDRRRTMITLTQQADDMLEQLYVIGHEITAETLKPLTAKESRQLLLLLSKLT